MSEELFGEGSVHIELYNPDSTVVPDYDLDSFGNFCADEIELEPVINYLTENYSESYREKSHSQIFTTQKVPILSIGIPGIMGTKQLVGEDITMENLRKVLQKED
jgi:hypothetical protein